MQNPEWLVNEKLTINPAILQKIVNGLLPPQSGANPLEKVWTEEGIDIAEYGLFIALIAIAAVILLTHCNIDWTGIDNIWGDKSTPTVISQPSPTPLPPPPIQEAPITQPAGATILDNPRCAGATTQITPACAIILQSPAGFNGCCHTQQRDGKIIFQYLQKPPPTPHSP